MKPRRKRVVIVDDSRAFADLLSRILHERYGRSATVEVYEHPYDALPRIDPTVDLLIADLEVPGMDGERLIDYARERGVPAQNIIVTSVQPGEELHDRIQLGEAIAVVNKTEAKQQEALVLILDAVMRRT